MKHLLILCLAAASARKPCAGAILHPAASPDGAQRVAVGPAGMMLTRRDCVWTERLEGGAAREVHRWTTDDLKLKRPFHAWTFVPPSGNGFLVFCPFPGNPLLAFYDRKARRVLAYAADQILTPEERRGTSPRRCQAEGPCGGEDLALAQDPRLSADGWSVEMKAARTERRIVFFLPLGAPVDDALDAKLLALLRQTPEERERRRAEAAALLPELDHPEIARRESAARELRARGPAAVDALAREATSSPEARARAADLLASLEPWTRVLDDPALLHALRHYPREEVARLARAWTR